MRRIIMAAIAAMIMMAPATARADAFSGLWLTENGKAVVELKPCENSMCGQIYWLRADAKQYDYQNPDAEARRTPLCGMRILWGFAPDGLTAWEDGTIYKADDGDTYHAEMEILEDGKLHLRGYIGLPLLGKSQIWTRAKGADYKRCAGPTQAYDAAQEGTAAAPAAGRVND